MNIGAISYNSQTLSDTQKTQARTNIDAPSKEEVSTLGKSLGFTLYNGALRWNGVREGREHVLLSVQEGAEIYFVRVFDEPVLSGGVDFGEDLICIAGITYIIDSNIEEATVQA